MKYQRIDFRINDEWMSSCFDDLNEECKDIVNDLINSSLSCQQWSYDKKHLYYTKIVAVTYELGRNKKRNKISKIISRLKDKFFCLVSRLVVYIP